MTHDQLVWAALIVAQFVVVSPLVLHLFFRTKPMTVPADLQAQFDRISAEIAQLKSSQSDPSVQTALDAANAEIAQLKQDAADAVTAASAIS